MRNFWIAAGLVAVWALAVTAPARAELVKKEGVLITARETGEAELGDGAKSAVKERAKMNALRKAIELYAGVHISSQSTMKNFEMEEDVVKAYNQAYVRSVRELSYTYDAAAERGVYQGEFVIDTAAMAQMAAAEKDLAAAGGQPVEAGVFLFDGEGRMLQNGKSVREGDRFNVMIQPATDLNAYVISRDAAGNLFNIFPNPDLTTQQNPLRAGIQYYFPPRDSDAVFAFDDKVGSERFYFLLSAVPMKDMDALVAKLGAMRTPAEKQALASIMQERIATRGIALASKSAQGEIVVSQGAARKMERKVGELLQGTGALVKTVLLHHVR